MVRNILDLENKVILITGATGFIGSSLVFALLEGTTNTTILAYGRSIKKLESSFSQYVKDSRLLLVAHDFADSAFVAKDFVGKVDYLFHAASPQDRHTVGNYPLQVIKSNISGLQNCIEYLLLQNKKFQKQGRLVVFSSLTIYGSADLGQVVVRKEHETNCTTSLREVSACYSESKRMCEVISNAAHRTEGLDVVICRFSTVFGRPLNPTNNAFYEFLDQASKGCCINVGNRYGPKRDNIYIKDAIDGLIVAAVNGVSGSTYNISSGGSLGNFLSVGEIALAVASQANAILHGFECVNVSFDNLEFVPDSGIKLDHTSLSKLGWRLKYSFDDALIDTFKSIK